jgi:hypothetical protein
MGCLTIVLYNCLYCELYVYCHCRLVKCIKLDVAIWVLAFEWRPCSLQHMASESDSHALEIRALNASYALNEF